MFDTGFWELVIIAVIALLVVGPDKLPAFAQQAGKWIGKIQRLKNNLQRELQQELSMDEDKNFKQQLSDLDELMKNAPDQDPDFNRKKKQISEKICL